MRVLFLDFDGVLHPLGFQTTGAVAANGKPRARAAAVDFFCWLGVLERLLAGHPDVGLVVHSTWRESHDEAALAAYLGPLQGRYLGRTADGDKVESIVDWLEANPGVQHSRILDDALDGLAPEDQLIACHWERGISDPDVQRQISLWLTRSA